MLILPAIDLKQGACVRLTQGRFDAVTEYGHPFARLRSFSDAGAEWVHVVDLDGARAREPVQHDLIARLVAETRLRVQSGGGVRTREHVATLLNAGVARVVVGSMAVRDPAEVRSWTVEFGPERICVALDVRAADGDWEVAADGWAVGAGVRLADALAQFPSGSLAHILVTDISRDGALSGPNVDLMRMIRALRPDLRLQASGGVSQLYDLFALREAGASTAIVGRALYEGRFTLEAALAL
ncbi:1-(5-phosphoribosyl)-5-[(5-phosphoribosylamino)methylideneamino]imidazole-4-carboxamide isomerase [Terricaulis silvestris]|uniref:1-(5-phosphoribosyl)-5-[(5-phosphoribosylamino)methylideneamino] imidazole-4-carboxamide isomerase n=1 Tax=Terricaulis silvestris TaxID=2686094 RepID=A0A6I6MGB4_9CAUL|nr:1-(5-phosphoribosyl)-5-[(5-phosphoribosylamino)methylideneamino]imidazole-4-carboxamide isomerase [Terricaulis silvestris]QGZ93630.1 1-(5-phosphoribosyl)-5-[(5-phosphoribosylamino)methylideneamino] imidazole-4-carboxamide isomerase [Terricaulis silvestris]